MSIMKSKEEWYIKMNFFRKILMFQLAFIFFIIYKIKAKIFYIFFEQFSLYSNISFRNELFSFLNGSVIEAIYKINPFIVSRLSIKYKKNIFLKRKNLNHNSSLYTILLKLPPRDFCQEPILLSLLKEFDRLFFLNNLNIDFLIQLFNNNRLPPELKCNYFFQIKNGKNRDIIDKLNRESIIEILKQALILKNKIPAGEIEKFFQEIPIYILIEFVNKTRIFVEIFNKLNTPEIIKLLQGINNYDEKAKYFKSFKSAKQEKIFRLLSAQDRIDILKSDISILKNIHYEISIQEIRKIGIININNFFNNIRSTYEFISIINNIPTFSSRYSGNNLQIIVRKDIFNFRLKADYLKIENQDNIDEELIRIISRNLNLFEQLEDECKKKYKFSLKKYLKKLPLPLFHNFNDSDIEYLLLDYHKAITALFKSKINNKIFFIFFIHQLLSKLDKKFDLKKINLFKLLTFIIEFWNNELLKNGYNNKEKKLFFIFLTMYSAYILSIGAHIFFNNLLFLIDTSNPNKFPHLMKKKKIVDDLSKYSVEGLLVFSCLFLKSEPKYIYLRKMVLLKFIEGGLIK